MKISLVSLIFQGIPESIALVVLAFFVAKAKVKWPMAILLGGILAVSAFFIRMLPVTFGLHTIVNIVLLLLFVTYFGRVNLISATVAVFLSFFILVFVETVIHYAMYSILNLSFEEISKNQVLMIISGIPQIVLLFLVAFGIKLYRK